MGNALSFVLGAVVFGAGLIAGAAIVLASRDKE